MKNVLNILVGVLGLFRAKKLADDVKEVEQEIEERNITNRKTLVAVAVVKVINTILIVLSVLIIAANTLLIYDRAVYGKNKYGG